MLECQERDGIKLKIKNVFKHIKLVSKHKWIVFKLCYKIGMPFRGFMHDWSKFSPQEFWESVKYYNGHESPIITSKKENGYSKAWLHHKGRNKHHPEYWIDVSLPRKTILMPYQYAAEMVCDKLAAGIVYNGKAWNKDTQIKYYMKERETAMIHPKLDEFLIEVFTEVSEKGLDETLTKNNIRRIYDKCCLGLERLDENKIQAVG